MIQITTLTAGAIRSQSSVAGTGSVDSDGDNDGSSAANKTAQASLPAPLSSPAPTANGLNSIEAILQNLLLSQATGQTA